MMLQTHQVSYHLNFSPSRGGRWALSNHTQSSTDGKDVFAFQNDTRYKRITQLMNMPRFHPLIYHFSPLYQKSSSPSITGCHAAQRPTLSCLDSLDLISVKNRKKKLNVYLISRTFPCVCVCATPTVQLHLGGKEQLVESLFLFYDAQRFLKQQQGEVTSAQYHCQKTPLKYGAAKHYL